MKRLNSVGKTATLAALGLFVARSALADGFRNPPDTAAALGKSGKQIVWSDDASAIFYNPANLGDVGARQVQVSALLGYSRAEYRGPLGRTETTAPWSLLPAFALAWPLQGTDVTAAFGMHVPYGRQTRWDADGPFRHAVPVVSKMSVMDFTPALAWRVSESVSLGAGIDLYYGRLRFRQLLPFPAPFPEGSIDAEADGFAVGGNAGISWRLTPQQRLALTVRTPFDLEFSGDLRTDDIPAFLPSAAESDVETTFKFPTIVALGYGVQLAETVRVEANVEWLQFSRFKNMAIDAGGNAPLAGMLGLANTAQNWDDTWTFGVGGDWRFASAWTLRAGYLYLQSPMPDNTFSPMALDSDQSVVSVGLGYKAGRHAVDLAYALGIFKTRRIGNNQNPLYRRGEYDFDGHLAAVTYTYAF